MLKLIDIQGNMFLISLVMGAGIGFTYDCIRCFRRIISHNNFFIAIEDIFFWITWAFVIIDKIHKYNYGSLRGYVFLGILLGAVFYLCTISCIFMPRISYILYHIKKYAKKINNMLKKRVKQVKIRLSLAKKSKNGTEAEKDSDIIGYGYGKKIKKKKVN